MKKNVTDYSKAKEIANTLQVMKEDTVSVDNLPAFRKYLKDFTRNTAKEFSTTRIDNKVRVTRIR